MYNVRRTKGFEKSFKKIKRSGKLYKENFDDLELIIDLLKSNRTLTKRFQDHQLKGDIKMYRECHIRNDVLLLYSIVDQDLTLVLIDIGSHSYLFR